MIQPHYFSTREAARKLGVSVERIRQIRLIRRKKGLPAIGRRLGPAEQGNRRPWMYTLEEVMMMRPRNKPGRPGKGDTDEG